MRITILFAWIIGFTIAASGLFYVTLRVEALEDQLAQLNRQILKEQENIHMLEAEWSYFNRPERIQKLANALLPELQPAQARQFISFQTLPYKLPTADNSITPSSGKSVMEFDNASVTSIVHVGNGGVQ